MGENSINLTRAIFTIPGETPLLKANSAGSANKINTQELKAQNVDSTANTSNWLAYLRVTPVVLNPGVDIVLVGDKLNETTPLVSTIPSAKELTNNKNAKIKVQDFLKNLEALGISQKTTQTINNYIKDEILTVNTLAGSRILNAEQQKSLENYKTVMAIVDMINEKKLKTSSKETKQTLEKAGAEIFFLTGNGEIVKIKDHLIRKDNNLVKKEEDILDSNQMVNELIAEFEKQSGRAKSFTDGQSDQAKKIIEDNEKAVQQLTELKKDLQIYKEYSDTNKYLKTLITALEKAVKAGNIQTAYDLKNLIDDTIKHLLEKGKDITNNGRTDSIKDGFTKDMEKNIEKVQTLSKQLDETGGKQALNSSGIYSATIAGTTSKISGNQEGLAGLLDRFEKELAAIMGKIIDFQNKGQMLNIKKAIYDIPADNPKPASTMGC
ncbi:MAG: hypothetical protein PHV30_00525 [Candidatus Margulisbacteria bacterium]|nr:hypothetical protein [Candidatus Margulisiibacteriota bacterium]